MWRYHCTDPQNEQVKLQVFHIVVTPFSDPILLTAEGSSLAAGNSRTAVTCRDL